MTENAAPAGDETPQGVQERGHLRRLRLLEKLDDGERVVIVRAEGGAGKTVLVADWMHSRPGLRTVWIAVDDRIVDGRSFWFRTFASLMSALPQSFHELTSAYASGLITPDESSALLTSALLSDPEPIVLVFDDLHHVDDEVQDQLVSLVRQIPHLRIVATTRRRTRFEALLVRGALDVRVIGSRELAFTRDEVSRLAHELPFPVEQTDLTMLERITRGHPLTTRLALFLMRTLSPDGVYRPSTDDIARGLKTVATDFLPPFEDEREERLALAISLCPEIDESLAARLDAEVDGWSTIERFEERGLGRITMRKGRTVFLMHTLVTSALRPRAERVLSPERIAEIRTAAFQELAELADPIDVLALLIDGGMDAAVFPHFVRNFSELSLHRTRELIEVLGALPEERLVQEGSLAITLATAMSEGSVLPVPQALRLAKAGMEALPSPDAIGDPAEAAMISLAGFAGLRIHRDYEGAAVAAEESLRRIDALRAHDDPDWFSAKLQIVFTAMIAHRIGRVRELSGVLDGDPHPGRRRHLDSLLAYAHAYAGDMPPARRQLDAIGDGDRSGWRGSHYAVGWHLASALQLANDGDADAALDLILPFLDELQTMDLWPAVIWTRGVIQLTAGRAAEGLEHLEDTLATSRTYPVSPGWSEQLQTLRAEFLMAVGDVVRAKEQLGATGDDPASRLARARLWLLLSQAHESLAELDRRTSAEYLPGQSGQRALLQAAAHAMLGDGDVASAFADRAISTLSRLESRLPFSLLPAGALEAVYRVATVTERVDPVGSPLEADYALVEPLTRRETVVLQGLASAKSLEDLAATLHVSPNTIKSQVRSIYRKLRVRSRSEAVRKAALIGLL